MKLHKVNYEIVTYKFLRTYYSHKHYFNTYFVCHELRLWHKTAHNSYSEQSPISYQVLIVTWNGHESKNVWCCYERIIYDVISCMVKIHNLINSFSFLKQALISRY